MAKKKEDPQVEAPEPVTAPSANVPEEEEPKVKECPFVPFDKSKEVDWMDEELKKEGRLSELPR